MVFFRQLAFAILLMQASSLTATSSEEFKGITQRTHRVTSKTTLELAKNKSLPSQRLSNNIPRRSLGRITRTANANSPAIARYPELKTLDMTQVTEEEDLLFRSPQLFGLNFDVDSLDQVNTFPPDCTGVAGLDQFVIFGNNIIKSFNKSTGQADGGIDTNPSAFFSDLTSNPISGPRIRYDRVTGRWILLAIDYDNSYDNNKILLAVSNESTITPYTYWYFYSINVGSGIFFAFPTIGIDSHALYIGGHTYSSTNSGVAFVVRKSSVLSGGSIVYTRFNDLIDLETFHGPFVPQGVDNFDANPEYGYFIGVDNASFGMLAMRRVSNPGGTPTISGNILISVPSTTYPLLVRHLGNDNGYFGRLDSLDDRLTCAHIRNNRLWTIHNIATNNEGISSYSVDLTRTASRWYEFDVSGFGTPELIQAGTLFDATAVNEPTDKSYWTPSIMTSGQGHMAIGCNVAGRYRHADATTVGRLATDTLGTTQELRRITQTEFAYNPPADPGSYYGRAWGAYSYTSVDPCDDMTLWTIQEYCNDENSWGVIVQNLGALPPARPVETSPVRVPTNQESVNVRIQGLDQRGSGFFDSGEGFDCRLQVEISGGVQVNSVEVIDKNTLLLNISTINAPVGSKTVTVTNPDGQFTRGQSILSICPEE
ncbi:hypothetical protein K2X40_00940 [Candidatus Babeliales bacterium]|nr:hypothetical protein [Candidatus Babeliales bacterium]